MSELFPLILEDWWRNNHSSGQKCPDSTDSQNEWTWSREMSVWKLDTDSSPARITVIRKSRREARHSVTGGKGSEFLLSKGAFFLFPHPVAHLLKHHTWYIPMLGTSMHCQSTTNNICWLLHIGSQWMSVVVRKGDSVPKHWKPVG